MQTPKYQHVIELEVRDYECDYQGVVNNAVYQNYLEHARHSCFRASLNVPELSRRGIDLVMAESNLRYLQPLRPHERFAVHSCCHLQGNFRLIFEQKIIRCNPPPNSKSLENSESPENEKSKENIVLQATICVAAVKNGRPYALSQIPEISALIDKAET